jgi:glycosyltransferase involved in cell wall biosynthesis
MDVPARCILVGDGSERCSLEALARDRDVEGWVSFCGYRDDVPDLLAAMDVYVNACRAEGFGLAVVEAMQSGLPVVVADAGALPELVRDGFDGFIVPAGNADALTRQLLRLALDPRLRRQVGAAGRETARVRFSAQRFAHETNGVFRRCADSVHRGAR